MQTTADDQSLATSHLLRISARRKDDYDSAYVSWNIKAPIHISNLKRIFARFPDKVSGKEAQKAKNEVGREEAQRAQNEVSREEAQRAKYEVCRKEEQKAINEMVGDVITGFAFQHIDSCLAKKFKRYIERGARPEPTSSQGPRKVDEGLGTCHRVVTRAIDRCMTSCATGLRNQLDLVSQHLYTAADFSPFTWFVKEFSNKDPIFGDFANKFYVSYKLKFSVKQFNSSCKNSEKMKKFKKEDNEQHNNSTFDLIKERIDEYETLGRQCACHVNSLEQSGAGDPKEEKNSEEKCLSDQFG